MKTELRKVALAIFALLGAGVAHAKVVDPAYDLSRDGSLYVCPDDNIVNGQLYILASECLQDGPRFGASELSGGNAQGASNPPLRRFWEDNLFLYNPTSGAYNFLGAFMTPINVSYGGESPFYELPFSVKNLVRSLISHGDSVVDVVTDSGSVLTMVYNAGGSGLVAFALTPVPEPATWTMMLLGLAGMGAAIRVARREKDAVFAAR